MDNFGLYMILTGPRIGHAAAAEAAVACGVRMLQLREKHLPDAELLRIARRVRGITRGSATRFVVNDRPDIAALCDADGVHVGQDDLPVGAVRRIIGPDRIVGLSTHSLSQAREALRIGTEPGSRIDYIGFGPVFPTTTKAVPDPVVGTELLREVIGFSTLPVVAIGGIFPENIREVLAAGARNPCLVRWLMEPDDPSETRRRIQQLQSLISGEGL